ncbi:MAG TPA: hypothetical protein VJH03_24410 [Blastocatellia bacterium]|nr:hypothetical protein [Blastocatellia bacterium]
MDANSFWYIYTTDGAKGFLLDLIRRPDAAVARLVVYSAGAAPIVTREFRRPSALAEDGSHTVQLDSLSLSPEGCHGKVGPIDIDIDFTLSPREISFVPNWLHTIIPYIPSFSSRYGKLESGACQTVRYENTPLVYSTYGVGRIERSKWYLISAPRFDGSDLSFEISAARVFGLWGPSAYVFFRGVEYKLNNALLSLFQFTTRRAGELSGGERVFEVSIRTRDLSLSIRAWAPAGDFAMLEQEGQTQIHTTLFGNCDARLTLRGSNEEHSFSARRTCLLEVKNKPQ